MGLFLLGEAKPEGLLLFAALAESGRRFLAMLWRYKQFSDGNLQCGGQPIQRLYGRVLYTPLDTTDIRTVNTGIHRQCLLRQSVLHA